MNTFLLLLQIASYSDFTFKLSTYLFKKLSRFYVTEEKAFQLDIRVNQRSVVLGLNKH